MYSIREYGEVVHGPHHGIRLRLNLATTFDCPFEGRMDQCFVVDRLARKLAHRTAVEVGLCDTAGRADPDHVTSLLAECLRRWVKHGTRLVFHGQDIYGGLAYVSAAWRAGIDGFDAALGGWGGCRFALGATGNTAIEDVAWTFRRMGIETGVALDRRVPLVRARAALPGAQSDGRVRLAPTASCAA